MFVNNLKGEVLPSTYSVHSPLPVSVFKESPPFLSKSIGKKKKKSIYLYIYFPFTSKVCSLLYSVILQIIIIP